jgi:predicted DNA binding CopG/RHH family protein
MRAKSTEPLQLVQVRMPQGLFEAVRKQATKEYLPMSLWIRSLCAEALERKKAA